MSSVRKQIKFLSVFLGMLVLSIQAFSQFDPPDPETPPDIPAGVPFDDHLHIFLIVAGIVFAVVILKRWYRYHATIK
jgi:hypothetical protein